MIGEWDKSLPSSRVPEMTLLGVALTWGAMLYFVPSDAEFNLIVAAPALFFATCAFVIRSPEKPAPGPAWAGLVYLLSALTPYTLQYIDLARMTRIDGQTGMAIIIYAAAALFFGTLLSLAIWWAARH